MTEQGGETYDVVIVGAGMVGATLACALERINHDGALRVLVVEAAEISSDHDPYQPSFDARSTALSAGSVQGFQMLGLWSALSEGATPIEHIHVSDQGRFGATRLHAEEAELPALGQVVENRWMGRVLNAALKEANSVEIRDHCRVTAVRPEKDGHALQLEETDGIASEIKSRLLVLADGGRSPLCEMLGIERDETPYGQRAIIANVATELPHNQVAYERFTEQGPLALLPLKPHGRKQRCALIWTREQAQADTLMDAGDEDFLAQLQSEVGHRLGRFLHVGERQSYPLSLVEAREQTRPGLVLLGNVAHALHPVAGQGFNLAVRNALVLADLIATRREDGDGPALGSAAQLKQYAERVSTDQRRTILFSDQVTRLFSSRQLTKRWCRQLGLLSIDLLPPLKGYLSTTAMGMGGRQPRLDLFSQKQSSQEKGAMP